MTLLYNSFGWWHSTSMGKTWRLLIWSGFGMFLLGTVTGCVVNDSFLDGQPCGPDNTCSGGYHCVREPCGSGYLCPVCRKHLPPADSDGGFGDGDSGGDRPDGGDLPGDQPVSCTESPPPCKTIPDCQDTPPTCKNGVWVCDTGFEKQETKCDGIDNDCDGKTDSGLVCVLAGSGNPGFTDGAGKTAQFNLPRGMCGHPSGGVVVADRGNHAIRLVAQDGATSTLAGTGHAGADDGAPSQATFNEPTGLALAPDGTILVADSLNDRIRRVGASVTTEAGSGFTGFQDGPAAQAKFAGPTGVAVEPLGTIFVADSGNHCIRKIAAGTVSTLAGKCMTPGFADGDSDARFNNPTDIVLLSSGQLLVSEESTHSLRLVTVDGHVTTLAGTGNAGFFDGPPLSSQFRKPAGCLEDTKANASLNADSGNNRVRSVTESAVITLLGSGAAGFDDGPPLSATFRQPSGLAFFGDGRLVIADTHNHAIRVVYP